MDYKPDMYALLICYTKDTENMDITLEDLHHIPYWRCVWGWLKTLVFYQINHNNERLLDVSMGLEAYSNMGNERISYNKFGVTKVTFKECKGIYGQ